MSPPGKSAPANPARRLAFDARASVAVVGFSAIIGQIVLMRELMVVFGGNEISMGITFATWLLWTAGGSDLASRVGFVPRHPRRAVAVLECLLALSLPPSAWLLRAFRNPFAAMPGELLGPVPMLLASFASLSLFCLISGALFVAAARMLNQEGLASPRDASSSAYMLEAIGSAAGGVLASLLLLRFLAPFQIASLVTLLNLFMAAALVFRPSLKRLVLFATAAAVCAAPLVFWVAPILERSSQRQLWRGFHLLESRDSIYGNLAITQTGGIRSIYSNGTLLANAPDPAAEEEAVHYALLEHSNPRRLLLIGGGINGDITEALKHPSVEHIDFVELDPALISLAQTFTPAQASVLSNPRVHLHFADGRAFLRSTSDTFDAILVNLPDPQTAQLNRFYTEEFFRAARAHLAPAGLLAFQLHSSEETISPDLADFLRCIQCTLTLVFPYTVAIPGDTIHYFAAMEPATLTADPRILLARMRERNLQNQYVREYFLPFRMMPDRMEQIQAVLQPAPSTPINRDFTPVAYYFNTVLWSTQFSSASSRWFRAVVQIGFSRLAAAGTALLLVAAAILAFLPAPKRAPASAGFSVAATGFTLMALQILLLLAFQSIYGYVYHQLAILFGLSMAGIAMGSWLGMRSAASGRPQVFAMARTQLLLALSAPALIGVVTLLARLSSTPATWIASQLVFPALAALTGLIGGFQFPIATAVSLHGSSSRQKLGTLYSMDLVGGCVGALLLSTLLIPLFGFWRTAWLCAAVNLAPIILAARTALASAKSPA